MIFDQPRLFATGRAFLFFNAGSRTQSSLSTVHRGVVFEERALAALSELSMTLRRVGGRNDGGVDLQGWWWVPIGSLDPPPGEDATARRQSPTLNLDPAGQERTRVRVLAQCKAEKKKLGPNYVREMEGVLHRFIASSSIHALQSDATDGTHSDALEPPGAVGRHPAVAIIVSSSEFTKAAVTTAISSSLPLLLVHIPPASSSSRSEHDFPGGPKEVGSAFWNPALGGAKGLLKGRMDIRWERHFNRDQAGSELVLQRPVLWYAGERLQSWVQPFPVAGDS